VSQKPIYATPASLGLQFKYVTFPSRVNQVQLKGWYIPGVLPNEHLTTQRTIIMVHGTRANRTDIVAIMRALRKITSWQRNSMIYQARAALIALGLLPWLYCCL